MNPWFMAYNLSAPGAAEYEIPEPGEHYEPAC